MNGLGRRLLIAPIRFYQRYLSPLKGPPSCRFYPTCSSYAIEAITVHGVLKGSYLAVRRVLKCHPLHPGGFDPVPPRETAGGRAPGPRRPDAHHEHHKHPEAS